MILERDRLTAQLSGFGVSGIEKMRNSSILIVGAGGLGSPVLAYLAALGVGVLGISDDDIVEESNLSRQIIHPTTSLGKRKSVSASNTVLALNPQVTTQVEPKITLENSLSIMSKYHLVIDATDNFPSKYLLSDTAVKLGIPLVWGTLVGMTFQISVFADGYNLRDIYPQPPMEGTTETSTNSGVLGAVCGQAGSIMATESIKYLTGVGTSLIGKLLIADTAGAKWSVISFKGTD